MGPGEQLGARLREARLARGMTLAEIQARTHIARETLEALERGEFDTQPADVYVRGFLRSYAREVGLDPTEVLAQYDGLRGGTSVEPWNRIGARVVRGSPEPLRHLAPVRRRRGRVPRPAGFVLTMLVVLLAGAGVLMVRSFTVGGGLTVPEVATPEPAPTETRSAAAGRGLPEWALHFVRSTQDATPLDEEAGAEQSGAATLPPPNWETGWELSPARSLGAGVDTPPRSGEHRPGAIRVRAVARADGWADVFADGARVFRGALLEGDEMVWQGQSAVRVRLEGAGHIDLYLNGVPLPPASEDVLEREFGVADVASALEGGEVSWE